MSNNLNSFQGKHVQGFCSASELTVVIDGEKSQVSIQFNRLYKVHDVCPRSIELPTRTIHLLLCEIRYAYFVRVSSVTILYSPRLSLSDYTRFTTNVI